MRLVFHTDPRDQAGSGDLLAAAGIREGVAAAAAAGSAAAGAGRVRAPSLGAPDKHIKFFMSSGALHVVCPQMGGLWAACMLLVLMVTVAASSGGGCAPDVGIAPLRHGRHALRCAACC